MATTRPKPVAADAAPAAKEPQPPADAATSEISDVRDDSLPSYDTMPVARAPRIGDSISDTMGYAMPEVRTFGYDRIGIATQVLCALLRMPLLADAVKNNDVKDQAITRALMIADDLIAAEKATQ